MTAVSAARATKFLPHFSSKYVVEDQLAALQSALAEDRSEPDPFVRGCYKVLQSIGRSEPLPQILNRLLRIAEQRLPGCGCRISMEANHDSRTEWDGGSWILPLAGAEAHAGEFIVRPRGHYELTETDRDLVYTLSGLAALAIRHHDIVERLNREAKHDKLTGLPNRGALQDRLEAEFPREEGTAGFAMLSIDLDRFKESNDTFGHAAGDDLLRAVTDRFRAALADGEFLARTGGDEFAIVLNCTGAAAAEACANRILGSLREPVSIGAHELFVTASIGISLFPSDAGDAIALRQNADAAMYQAKSRGKNQYCRYEPIAGKNALERLELGNALRRALDNNELELYYQPQVNLEGALTGMEALIRWKHPSRGLMTPHEFIPLAEETGLILPIGAWVIREACRQAASWQQSGLQMVKVAVNVSAVQFYYTDVAGIVRSALEEFGVKPEYLELELTENLVMQDSQQALAQINELRRLGVTVAIDDFGTGYSSLSYLHKLPIDLLKIDRSFLEHSDARSRAAFVQAITVLAHNLGLRVVAEGIENDDQWQQLREAGVDFAQGYLIGRPMPKQAASAMLQEVSGRCVA